ncbi:transcription initiation protein [Nakamurella sp. YIM 132087]|uniref:Transcription initiation protein n=1 Tax=Nakamurella alba TaxID=2665158 RepID=A0A7K1FV95_9ACTN|nr:YciI family protein [Nakamurella alba]MTD16754.1 transcription initiation protein [Nakamurella alba]
MALYLALTYTADVNWWDAEHAEELAEYRGWAVEHADALRSSALLHPTPTATVVRVDSARGGQVITTDGPYAETKEALTGYYVIEAEDLDQAVAMAAQLPAARNGAVEIRPLIAFR